MGFRMRCPNCKYVIVAACARCLRPFEKGQKVRCMPRSGDHVHEYKADCEDIVFVFEG